MKNHIAFKFIAIFLCALLLTTSVVCVAGIYSLSVNGLYDQTLEEMNQERQDRACMGMAYNLVGEYAAENLSNCSQEVLENTSFYSKLSDEYYDAECYLLERGEWFYTIADQEGNILEQSEDIPAGTQSFEVTLDYYYPVLVATMAYDIYADEMIPATTATTAPTLPQETMHDELKAYQSTDPLAVTEPDPYDYDYWEEAQIDGILYRYYLRSELTPLYTVTLYLTDDAFSYYDDDTMSLLLLLQENRFNLLIFLALGLLLFAIGAVYLCCAAGRTPGSDEVRPGGLNRIPLDLYAGGLLLAAVFLVLLGDDCRGFVDSVLIYLIFLAALVFVGCLLFVGFCYACAAQFKTAGGYWWRHSFTGWACITAWKILKMIFRGLGRVWNWTKANVPVFLAKLFGSVCRFFIRAWEIFKSVCLWLWAMLCRTAGGIWNLIRRGFRWLGRGFNRVFSLLPLTWQWLLTGVFLVAVLFITISSRNSGWLLIGIAISLGVILYGAQAFGILLEGVKHMSGGDLDTKVSDQFLVGSFREFAGDLNALADVAVVAARNQMKSERMKTELITNVSHDIKTPLTSIINYVDLLEKPHTPEEEQAYLEVLGRQSQRMKKLIEDLVEMSKASTGNMTADIREVDAVEAINQALGEYADKLEQTNLTPVFNQPEEPVLMKADGRLAWRVLSNLLSNAVKYALPGTRLYIDLVKVDGKVLISLKNISREQLNVAADELMERFVRGDASRNTEGSGLGLNIAKSLMEVQHGQLQLLVDGDLFKATVIFPAA